MITVWTSGVNSFTLKGSNLDGCGSNASSIALMSDGWQIELNIYDYALQRQTRLHENAVLISLKEMLENCFVDEDVDEKEILYYMSVVERAARKYPLG
jgi:hypothetical protein